MPRRNRNQYNIKRQHTNNTGLRSIKNGTTRKFIKQLARELGIPYGLPRGEENATNNDNNDSEH